MKLLSSITFRLSEPLKNIAAPKLALLPTNEELVIFKQAVSLTKIAPPIDAALSVKLLSLIELNVFKSL